MVLSAFFDNVKKAKSIPIISNIKDFFSSTVTRLLSRDEVRQILGNTSWLMADRVFRLFMTLLVSVWVARYLGVRQYGQLNIALAYVVLVMPILSLGLNNVIVKYIADDDSDRNLILGTSATLRFLTALFTSPFLLLLVAQLHPDDPIITIIVGLLLLGTLFQSLEVIDSWFQSQVKSKFTVWSRSTAFFITSLLKIGAILLESPLIVFGFLYFFDIMIYILILAWNYQRSGETIQQWQFQAAYGRNLLRTAWPLIISGMAVAAYMRIDQLMLAQLVGEEAVGTYAVAVRLSEMWYFIPGALATSIFPAVIQSKKSNESLYRKRVQRYFNMMVFISYTIAIPISILSSTIVLVLFGEAYRESGTLLAILVWAGVWVSLGLARTSVLHAEDLLRFSAYATIMGAIINIVLNLILIPQIGAIGCAIATLISQIFAAQVTTVLYPATRDFGLMQTRALLYPNIFRS